uniref:Uncharacterized protein n=1 Tax=Anguilla anguilla TaxID=7936 RepID=A0A0E9U6X8_ANGAN
MITIHNSVAYLANLHTIATPNSDTSVTATPVQFTKLFHG